MFLKPFQKSFIDFYTHQTQYMLFNEKLCSKNEKTVSFNFEVRIIFSQCKNFSHKLRSLKTFLLSFLWIVHKIIDALEFFYRVEKQQKKFTDSSLKLFYFLLRLVTHMKTVIKEMFYESLLFPVIMIFLHWCRKVPF